ncbi:MAG: Gfo/Idh/MocA family oxidoreductase [Acidimicrobiales bacterium]|nr:Gfo/Idh/MocA family oxidoreductase [Acidimicrobiales bacterium]
MSPTGPRVLVVGAGSIGARHVRNLVAAGASVVVADLDAARARSVADDAGAEAATVEQACADGSVDGAVLATPTTLHADQAAELLAAVPKLLVEKPLASSADAAADLAAEPDRVAVAYNLRLHEPVRRLVAMAAEGRAGRISAVRLWFGSWLPDWRPGTDYRLGYSARRDLGGGVLLDAIHELDLLVWLCGRGPHQVVGATVDRLGPLEVDVEDTVKALIRTDGGVVAEVSLDYLARRYRRGIEVTGDRATLRLDWARGTIAVEDADGATEEPAVADVADSYVAQARSFVDWLGGGSVMPVDAAEGAASVALADQIRDAAR